MAQPQTAQQRVKVTIKAVLLTATVEVVRDYFGHVTATILHEIERGISDEDRHLLDIAEMQMQRGEVDQAFATLDTYHLAVKTEQTVNFAF